MKPVLPVAMKNNLYNGVTSWYYLYNAAISWFATLTVVLKSRPSHNKRPIGKPSPFFYVEWTDTQVGNSLFPLCYIANKRGRMDLLCNHTIKMTSAHKNIQLWGEEGAICCQPIMHCMLFDTFAFWITHSKLGPGHPSTSSWGLDPEILLGLIHFSPNDSLYG